MRINRHIQARLIGVVTLSFLVFALATCGDVVAKSASANDRSDNATGILQKAVLSTGVEIPAAVSSIRNAEIRHKTVVDKTEMEGAVKAFLGI